MFKKYLDIVVDSLIEIGQELLKIDGIGFDAMCIGCIIIGLNQLRSRILKSTNSDIILNEYTYRTRLNCEKKNID